MADYDAYINAMNSASAANSAFNAEQAALNRAWQTEMSNTAHQREVQDLIAAGLNPILSVNSGATVSTGSSASADSSSASGYAALANTAINNLSQVAVAGINAGAILGSANLSQESSFINSAASIATAAIAGASLLGSAFLKKGSSAKSISAAAAIPFSLMYEKAVEATQEAEKKFSEKVQNSRTTSSSGKTYSGGGNSF